MLNKKIYIILISLLLIPFIAMQFTNEIKWSVFDFVIMGILLLLIGFFYNLSLIITKSKSKRIILISIFTLFLILIWIELSVGIFNSPIGGS